MLVDEIGDSNSVDELTRTEHSSSTWNGRDIQCAPLDETALLVKAYAYLHLAAQKEGLKAVRKLEQEIYALNSLDEEDDDSELDEPDPDYDAMMNLIQALSYWSSPELVKAEERVKLLLNDPTRPDELLHLHKGSFIKGIKAVLKIRHKAGKTLRKHKKAVIVTTAAVAAVAVIIATGGGAAPGAIAGVAAVAATPSSSGSSRKRDDEERKPSSTGASPAGNPPPPPSFALEGIGSSSPSSSTSSLFQPTTFSNHVEPMRPLTTASLPNLSALDTHRQVSKPSFNPQPYIEPATPNWKPQMPPVTAIRDPMQPGPAFTSKHPAVISNPSMNVVQPPPSKPVLMIDPDGPPRVYKNEPSPRMKFEIPGAKLARGCIGGINGIGNDYEDAQESAKYLSQLCNNYQLEWVHNRTNTPALDVLETIGVFKGFSILVQPLLENWVKFHEAHKNDPDAKYLQVSHSQGASHVKEALLQAPQEIRERVISLALAPASVIPQELCFASFNYASKRDFVSYAEAAVNYDADASYEERMSEPSRAALKELILLDPHPDAPLFDHGLASLTFRGVLIQNLDNFINKYGMPK